MDRICFDAVIFDMDGVIFDSESTWAMFDKKADELFGTDFGPHVRDEFCGMDEASIRSRLKAMRPTLDVAAYREYIISHVHEYENEHGARLKTGFTELISSLKNANKRIGLATSSRRERIGKLFNKAGLNAQSLFDATVCGEDVKVAKPDPDIFIKTAQCLNVIPSRTVVIEDSINGIKAAFAGGFIPIMAVDLIPPPNDYLRPPYDLRVANDLKEVRSLLGM